MKEILQKAADEAFHSKVKIDQVGDYFQITMDMVPLTRWYTSNQLRVFLDGVLIGRKEEIRWIKDIFKSAENNLRK